MQYVDADGHVEENPATFDDKYLDPAFRALRPRVVAMDGLVYWSIEEQLFPRRERQSTEYNQAWEQRVEIMYITMYIL